MIFFISFHKYNITIGKENLGLDGVLSLRESLLSLLLLDGLGLNLSSRESSSDGSGLLSTQVLGDVLLGLVELTELVSLSEVNDSKNSSNRLLDLVNLGGLNSVGGGLQDTELGKLLLKRRKLSLELSLGLVA